MPFPLAEMSNMRDSLESNTLEILGEGKVGKKPYFLLFFLQILFFNEKFGGTVKRNSYEIFSHLERLKLSLILNLQYEKSLRASSIFRVKMLESLEDNKKKRYCIYFQEAFCLNVNNFGTIYVYNVLKW